MIRILLNAIFSVFILLSCTTGIPRPYEDKYKAAYFIYLKKDDFGRKYFKWRVRKKVILRGKYEHIRVFLNKKNQVVIYEINEFYERNYQYLVERRELGNITEQFTWYFVDSVIMFYEGMKTYFFQLKYTRAKEVGFFKYDASGRLIKEDIYNRYNSKYLTIRYVYEEGVNPVKKIEDEIIFEKFENSQIKVKIARKTYTFSGKEIVDIKLEEILK